MKSLEYPKQPHLRKFGSNINDWPSRCARFSAFPPCRKKVAEFFFLFFFGQHHPDKASTQEQSFTSDNFNEQHQTGNSEVVDFTEIQNAWEVLKDEQKRATYDTALEGWILSISAAAASEYRVCHLFILFFLLGEQPRG